MLIPTIHKKRDGDNFSHLSPIMGIRDSSIGRIFVHPRIVRSQVELPGNLWCFLLLDHWAIPFDPCPSVPKGVKSRKGILQILTKTLSLNTLIYGFVAWGVERGALDARRTDKGAKRKGGGRNRPTSWWALSGDWWWSGIPAGWHLHRTVPTWTTDERFWRNELFNRFYSWGTIFLVFKLLGGDKIVCITILRH